MVSPLKSSQNKIYNLFCGINLFVLLITNSIVIITVDISDDHNMLRNSFKA